MGKIQITFVGYGVTSDSGEAAIFQVYPKGDFGLARLFCVHCEWGSPGYTLHIRELGLNSATFEVNQTAYKAFDLAYKNSTGIETQRSHGKLVSKALKAVMVEMQKTIS